MVEAEDHYVARRRRPAWNPSGWSRYVTCRNPTCGNEHVDPDFARTFGDDDGTVFACPDCTPWAALKRGAAADPTFEHRVRRDSW
ncbi:DUF7563 family protein [Haladaptatus halobius]|uniref:DUF7563 family protein n=1 Tax=Haladaptatus halobius TaxID=2884875 RepID=UPI001D0B1253|nr:hypothetical protein [Haladaptatus halobius]